VAGGGVDLADLYLVTHRGTDGKLKSVHMFKSLDFARWHIADELESHVEGPDLKRLVEQAFALPPSGGPVILPDQSSYAVRPARIKEVRRRGEDPDDAGD